MEVLCVFLILASLLSLVVGDVEFVAPAEGADVPVGTIKVQWQDSGSQPSLADLTQYTLTLMFGGNADADMLPLATFVSQGFFAAGNDATGTISSGIAESVTNAFFMKIVAADTNGSTITNYSPRFSILGMTGSVPSKYREAAQALDGSTTSPANDNNAGSGSSSGASSVAPSPTLTNAASVTATTTAVAAVTQVTGQTTTIESLQPSSTSSSSTSKQQSGLSTGALVGLSVALPVVAIIAIILALIVIFQRKKLKKSGSADEDDMTRLAESEPKRNPSIVVAELYNDSHIFEASDGAVPPEMDHMAVRAELEGDWEAYEAPTQRFSK